MKQESDSDSGSSGIGSLASRASPLNLTVNPPTGAGVSSCSEADERETTSVSPGLQVQDPKVWSFEEQFRQLYEIDNDPERKKFLDELFAFMQKRGTPVNRIPIMAKQTLDLHLLFRLVVAKGGLVEVINRKLWREITKGLNLPHSITSAAFTLRTQYMKYLYPFECEKYKLSTMEELNSAIDGNRRDSRNIQSPPTSPRGGAFGGGSFFPQAYPDLPAPHKNLFPFPPAYGNPLFQYQQFNQRNSENENEDKRIDNRADLMAQAMKLKQLSALMPGQQFPAPAGNTPSSAMPPAANFLNYNTELASRLALAQSQQQAAIMQAAALYEHQQMTALENLRRQIKLSPPSNEHTPTVPPRTLVNEQASSDSDVSSRLNESIGGRKSPMSEDSPDEEFGPPPSKRRSPSLAQTPLTIKTEQGSPDKPTHPMTDLLRTAAAVNSQNSAASKILPDQAAITNSLLEQFGIRVVAAPSENEITLSLTLSGKIYEGTLKTKTSPASLQGLLPRPPHYPGGLAALPFLLNSAGVGQNQAEPVHNSSGANFRSIASQIASKQ